MVDNPSDATKENPVGRRVFQRGLAIRGGTQLVFAIPPGTSMFEAEVGIQTNKKQLGQVDVDILVDGERIASQKVGIRSGNTKKFEVACTGKQLTIVVGYGEKGNVGDIAVLGNARFQLGK